MRRNYIQKKLLTTEGYTPSCGNLECRVMPSTYFNGKQFVCPCCGWESSYPNDFIEEYKKKWKK